MTEWQWKVIIALVRLMLNSQGLYLYSYNDEKAEDIDTLEEALHRERQDD